MDDITEINRSIKSPKTAALANLKSQAKTMSIIEAPATLSAQKKAMSLIEVPTQKGNDLRQISAPPNFYEIIKTV